MHPLGGADSLVAWFLRSPGCQRSSGAFVPLATVELGLPAPAVTMATAPLVSPGTNSVMSTGSGAALEWQDSLA